VVRFGAPLLGLVAAMLAHGLHNTTVSLVDPYPGLLCLTILADWGGVLFVLAVMVLSIRRERQWLIAQLQEEVANETLSQVQYEVSISPVRRFGARLSALLSGGPGRWLRLGQYLNRLTALAYSKHARVRRGDEGASLASIEELRARVAQMSAEFADVI
jgi:hypothetical protein